LRRKEKPWKKKETPLGLFPEELGKRKKRLTKRDRLKICWLRPARVQILPFSFGKEKVWINPKRKPG